MAKTIEETAKAFWPDDKGMQLIAKEQAKKVVDKYKKQ